MPIYNPVAGSKIAYGTYTGDNTANKAIAHGMSGTPRLVIITSNEAGATAAGGRQGIIQQGSDRVYYFDGGANSSLAVTAPDSTNFYVGNATNTTQSCNGNTIPYIWVAFL